MSTPVGKDADVATMDEEELRRSLRLAMQQLKSREPLEPTYKHWLLDGRVTPRRPVLVRDKVYRRLGSGLRARVEAFSRNMPPGADPLGRIAQRPPPPAEPALRAALTLREAKPHEQRAWLEATLAGLPRQQGMDPETRRRYLDAVALGLQSARKVPAVAAAVAPSRAPPTAEASAAEQTEQARQQAELDRQREQARLREAARLQREEEERRTRDGELDRRRKQAIETPKQALHKLYYPIFKKLWDMEFPQLGGINPFRIVIDRENCASVGAPDYFDVIEKPMNLAYIQDKVDGQEYDTLSAFFGDIDLMIKNCLLYNSDPSNPYHIAAQELKKRYIRMAKKVVQTIQSKQIGRT